MARGDLLKRGTSQVLTLPHHPISRNAKTFGPDGVTPWQSASVAMDYAQAPQGGAPPVISWFIIPINYGCIPHRL